MLSYFASLEYSIERVACIKYFDLSLKLSSSQWIALTTFYGWINRFFFLDTKVPQQTTVMLMFWISANFPSLPKRRYFHQHTYHSKVKSPAALHSQLIIRTFQPAISPFPPR